MQSKSLLNYQFGYTGAVVDLEAIKPWERKCYLLGVWHVASASEPLITSGGVVRAIRKMVKEQTCKHESVSDVSGLLCAKCGLCRKS